jgi:hypothetical protein
VVHVKLGFTGSIERRPHAYLNINTDALALVIFVNHTVFFSGQPHNFTSRREVAFVGPAPLRRWARVRQGRTRHLTFSPGCPSPSSSMLVRYLKTCPLCFSLRAPGATCRPGRPRSRQDSRLLPALAWPFCYKALRF